MPRPSKYPRGVRPLSEKEKRKFVERIEEIMHGTQPKRTRPLEEPLRKLLKNLSSKMFV